MDGLTFLDGSTNEDGGAIRYDGAVMLGGSRFVNNTAQNLGGAIAASYSDLMMDSVAFIMNHCIQGDGGGLYVDNNHTEDYRNVGDNQYYFC